MFKEYSAFKVNSQWRDYTKLDLDHKSLSFLAFLFILHNKNETPMSQAPSQLYCQPLKQHIYHTMPITHLWLLWKMCGKGKTLHVWWYLQAIGWVIAQNWVIIFFPAIHIHNLQWPHRQWEWLHHGLTSLCGSITYSGLLKANESSVPCWHFTSWMRTSDKCLNCAQIQGTKYVTLKLTLHGSP